MRWTYAPCLLNTLSLEGVKPFQVLLQTDAEATVDYKDFLRCIDYTKSHEAPPTDDDLAPPGMS